MVSSKSFLDKAQELKARGVEFSFEMGTRVARGYADLGTEEFQLIGPFKTVSLFTGKQSEIPEEHLKFFFRVPELEELTDELTRRGAVVLGLAFRDQRRWILTLRLAAEQRDFEHEALEETFVDALLSLLPQAEESQKPPRLKTVKE